MPKTEIADPILARFRAALAALYGDRLERVVLFGSRARGDAHADSDYDTRGQFWRLNSAKRLAAPPSLSPLAGRGLG